MRVDVAEASAPMKRLPGDSGGTMPFLHNLPCPPFAMQGSPSPSYPRSSLSYPPSVPPPPSVPGVRPGASQGQGQGHCALNLGTDNKTQQSPVRKHRPGGAQGDNDHDAQPRARGERPMPSQLERAGQGAWPLGMWGCRQPRRVPSCGAGSGRVHWASLGLSSLVCKMGPGIPAGSFRGCSEDGGVNTGAHLDPTWHGAPQSARGFPPGSVMIRTEILSADREPPLLRTSTLTGPSSCCLPRGQCGIRTAQILGGMGSMQELGAHTAGERAEGSRRARDTTRFTADLTRRPASSDWN